MNEIVLRLLLGTGRTNVNNYTHNRELVGDWYDDDDDKVRVAAEEVHLVN